MATVLIVHCIMRTIEITAFAKYEVIGLGFLFIKYCCSCLPLYWSIILRSVLISMCLRLFFVSIFQHPTQNQLGLGLQVIRKSGFLALRMNEFQEKAFRIIFSSTPTFTCECVELNFHFFELVQQETRGLKRR